jgi:hypothetical protein
VHVVVLINLINLINLIINKLLIGPCQENQLSGIIARIRVGHSGLICSPCLGSTGLGLVLTVTFLWNKHENPPRMLLRIATQQYSSQPPTLSEEVAIPIY